MYSVQTFQFEGKLSQFCIILYIFHLSVKPLPHVLYFLYFLSVLWLFPFTIPSLFVLCLSTFMSSEPQEQSMGQASHRRSQIAIEFLLPISYSHLLEISNAVEFSNEQSSERKWCWVFIWFLGWQRTVGFYWEISWECSLGVGTSCPCSWQTPLDVGEGGMQSNMLGTPPSLGDPQEVSVNKILRLLLPLQLVHTSNQTNLSCYLLKYYMF